MTSTEYDGVQLEIPERLYGRDVEVRTLLNAFAWARKSNSALLTVGGHAGVGKTTLVLAVQEPILAARAGDCRVLGLPGNPVSTYAGFAVFGAPLLRRMMGRQRWRNVELPVTLLEEFLQRPGRVTYHLARIDEINPFFGNEQGFIDFVTEANSRGIKVFVDVVAYGISADSTFFQDAFGNPQSQWDSYLAFTNAANTRMGPATQPTTWSQPRLSVRPPLWSQSRQIAQVLAPPSVSTQQSPQTGL